MRQVEVPASLTFAQGQRLGADKPRHAHPGGQSDDDHDIEETGLKKGHNGQNEEKGREAEHDIHETHDDFVDKASEIAADEAEQGADGDGDTHGHEAHPEGNASAVEEPREHVASETVRAQGKFRAGGFQNGVEMQLIGVKGGDKRREDGREGDAQHDNEAEDEHGVAPQDADEAVRCHYPAPLPLLMRGSARP